MTVAELAVQCKESKQKMYHRVVERFIVPSYGDVAVQMI